MIFTFLQVYRVINLKGINVSSMHGSRTGGGGSEE